MAIGTPVQLGAGTSSGTSTTVITTSGAITAGDLAVVLVEESSSITVSGVADSAGNTYTAGTAIVSGTRLIQPFYKPNAAAMSSGGTITVTRSASTGVGYAAAISVSGMDTSSPIDIQTAGSVGTATGYTLATGTLGQADELLVCFTFLSSGSGDAYVQPSGFTANTAASDGTNVLRSGYLIVSSTTTTSPHPTWGVSRTFLGQVVSFKAAGAGGPNNASASITFGALTVAGTATTPDLAAASITLGALTLAGTATVLDKATASITFGALTLVSTATTPDLAQASITLGALTVAGTATALDTATASITFGALTVVGTATVTGVANASASITFGALTVVGTATTPDLASASITLGALSLAATATVAVKASASITLGALTLVGTAARQSALIGAITLGELSLAALMTAREGYRLTPVTIPTVGTVTPATGNSSFSLTAAAVSTGSLTPASTDAGEAVSTANAALEWAPGRALAMAHGIALAMRLHNRQHYVLTPTGD